MKKSHFSCIECEHEVTKWLGKCPKCYSWNTFQEISKSNQKTQKKSTSQQVSEITLLGNEAYTTGLDEFDRVLGKGLVKNSVTLIGGSPGVGKSTLMLEVCKRLIKKYDSKILYVSGEETTGQVASRIERIGLKIKAKNIYLLHEQKWEGVKEEINILKPDFLVLDSIQTTQSTEINGAAGSMQQVREVTYELVRVVKSSKLTAFIVGQVTKDGSVAGPKLLEHMVDTVLYFEDIKSSKEKILRSYKNRFGSVEEIGIFEMKERGLFPKITSSINVSKSHQGVIGRTTLPVLKGERLMFVEIQCLCFENKTQNNKVTAQGVDLNRLNLLIAIIYKYIDPKISYHSLYLNIANGEVLKERDSDLAIIIAILSSFYNLPVCTSSLFMGEVSLAGTIKPSRVLDSRYKELKRLAYTDLYAAFDEEGEEGEKFNQINFCVVSKVSDVLEMFGMRHARK